MTNTLRPEAVHDILDQLQSGDRLTVTRPPTDDSQIVTVSGPVVVNHLGVVIELCYTDPYVVRGEGGEILGDFTRVMAERYGELFGAEYVPAEEVQR